MADEASFFGSFLPLTLHWLINLALSKEEGVVYYFFAHIYVGSIFEAALHVHKCIKAHLDFDSQLLSVIVSVSIKSLFTFETIQLKGT
jgi:hypothetical protein